MQRKVKLAKLQVRPRRNNLHINEMGKENAETQETCKKKMQQIPNGKFETDKEISIDRNNNRTGKEKKRKQPGRVILKALFVIQKFFQWCFLVAS